MESAVEDDKSVVGVLKLQEFLCQTSRHQEFIEMEHESMMRTHHQQVWAPKNEAAFCSKRISFVSSEANERKLAGE